MYSHTPHRAFRDEIRDLEKDEMFNGHFGRILQSSTV